MKRSPFWYTEPWSIYLIGRPYPGPSKHGYSMSLTFTSLDGKSLNFSEYVGGSR
jgi:hypothetical protein